MKIIKKIVIFHKQLKFDPKKEMSQPYQNKYTIVQKKKDYYGLLNSTANKTFKKSKGNIYGIIDRESNNFTELSIQITELKR